MEETWREGQSSRRGGAHLLILGQDLADLGLQISPASLRRRAGGIARQKVELYAFGGQLRTMAATS